MHPYEFNISLRLTHPEMDLTEIYEKLSAVRDLTPRRIWRAGDQRLAQNGQPLEGKYDKSYCYFDLYVSPQKSAEESLSLGIERILSELSSYTNDIDDHVKSGGKAELFVGMYVDSNSSDTFSSHLLRKLADSQIELSFDIYSYKSNGDGKK